MKKDDVFMKVPTKVPVTRETIANLFCCAVEGGSNYWCSKIRPLDKEDKRGFMEYMMEGFYVTVPDEEEGTKEVHKVLPVDIQHALEIMGEQYDWHFRNAVDNDGVSMDAETGDVFLQLCTFKELVYG